MTKAQQSALTGIAVAVIALLVSLGVFGGDTAGAVQAVANAVIAFAGTVFVHSALPPKGE